MNQPVHRCPVPAHLRCDMVQIIFLHSTLVFINGLSLKKPGSTGLHERTIEATIKNTGKYEIAGSWKCLAFLYNGFWCLVCRFSFVYSVPPLLAKTSREATQNIQTRFLFVTFSIRIRFNGYGN